MNNLAALKLVAILWLASIIPGFFLSHQSMIGFVLGWFPLMVVHELGHATAGLLAAIPTIPFFFMTFSLSNSPSWFYFFLLLIVEAPLIVFFLRKTSFVIPIFLLTLCALSQLAFLTILETHSVEFTVFGGMAGELVLPALVLYVILAIPIFRYGPHGLGAVILSAETFWHSLKAWIYAALGWAPIPYPPDGQGAALFVDPFAVAKGEVYGDLDRLTKIYHWTDGGLIAAYLVIGILSLLTMLALLAACFVRESRE